MQVSTESAGDETTSAVQAENLDQMGDVKFVREIQEASSRWPQGTTVAQCMTELGLDDYTNQLVVKQGYDMLEDLDGIPDEELSKIADECGMKTAHKKRFVRAFSSQSVMVGTLVEPSRDSPSKSTRLEQIELQEETKLALELKQMKEAMQEDKLKREKEAEMLKLKEQIEQQQHTQQREMEMKLEIERMKTDFDRKLMESKLQQQSVDMQQNLVMSMNSKDSSFRANNEASASGVPGNTSTAATEGVALAEGLDPKLRAAMEKFIALDASGKVDNLNSTALTEEVKPMQETFVSCKLIYHTFLLHTKVVVVAFNKLANGRSVSGVPKSPIDLKSHPDYPVKDVGGIGVLMKDAPAHWLCYDYQQRLDLLAGYPYFNSEPVFKNMLQIVRDFDVKKLNKDGKRREATRVVAAADEVMGRLQAQEIRILLDLNAKLKQWREIIAMRKQEEEAAMPCCGCVVM
ncbi:hypothetical protein AB1Y20_010210 [Prymnesium parvum]|uniref:SAM domain-containing protein n=1 Tax=Prymnesium parvum TaxID=97485 RepID=A0AB34K6Q6_PRYPA